MILRACTREAEVAQAIRSGHWPSACDAELRKHVAGCARCGDLATVKSALVAMRVPTRAAAWLESPALLMWRAQIRRRNEALERVARPMLVVYGLTLAMVVTVLAGMAVLGVRAGVDWQAWGQMLGWAALAGVATLGGVAAYVAVDRD